jgi:septation ring formation regulator EzrA
MHMTFDIKTLITVAGVIAVLGGFYYSTQHRLESLESQLNHVSSQLDEQTGELSQIKKQLKKIK